MIIIFRKIVDEFVKINSGASKSVWPKETSIEMGEINLQRNNNSMSVPITRRSGLPLMNMLFRDLERSLMINANA